MIAVLKKVWLPLLIVVVVVIAGLTVSRIRTFFGSEGIIETPRNFADLPEPFDPKVIRYEVSGNGSYADVNYLDLEAKPQRIDGVAIPWSLTLSTTEPSAAPNLVAQGDGGSITCRIFVDDELKDERTSNGVNAQTFCFVKNA
ncbi:MmpS family transport accessory protein [Mycobacterium sp. SMC-4]|uniref:MmpS family transport accessory protein n=1 Tax=Mycobacterium sp. SMC-4 TaxID=2857059 RepID=UPI003CFF5343